MSTPVNKEPVIQNQDLSTPAPGGQDFLSELPQPLIQRIFTLIGLKEASSLKQTCKSLSHSYDVWVSREITPFILGSNPGGTLVYSDLPPHRKECLGEFVHHDTTTSLSTFYRKLVINRLHSSEIYESFNALPEGVQESIRNAADPLLEKRGVPLHERTEYLFSDRSLLLGLIRNYLENQLDALPPEVQEVAHWEIFNRMSEASETSLYVDHRDFAAYGKQHAFRNYLLLADVLTAISDPFDFQRIISYRNRLIVEHVPAPNVDIELSESESEALDSDEASSSESFELFMQGAQTPEAEEASDEESDNSLSLSSLSELTDEEIGFLNTANG